MLTAKDMANIRFLSDMLKYVCQYMYHETEIVTFCYLLHIDLQKIWLKVNALSEKPFI